MSKRKLAGAFNMPVQGRKLPHLPVRPKRSLTCMVGVKIEPEMLLFLELLAKQDEDTVSGTVRRICHHFKAQWEQSLKDREADQ